MCVLRREWARLQVTSYRPRKEGGRAEGRVAIDLGGDRDLELRTLSESCPSITEVNTRNTKKANTNGLVKKCTCPREPCPGCPATTEQYTTSTSVFSYSDDTLCRSWLRFAHLPKFAHKTLDVRHVALWQPAGLPYTACKSQSLPTTRFQVSRRRRPCR